jgi:hypothetical protein
MSERRQGYIYVGGYQPHPDVLYIKAGKTNRPKDRVKDYGGMVPGGLSFMRAAKVDNSHRAETQLLAAVASVEGVEAIGGEWFKCHPFQKLLVLDKLHEIGREVVQVHTYCPAPFGVATTGKRGINRRSRRG